MKLITKIGGKALPRLGGNGKILGGIPHLRHHRDDGRSAHESETFNVENEILRKRTERSVADHGVSHESMMVERGGHGLPNSRTTTFRLCTRRVPAFEN